MMHMPSIFSLLLLVPSLHATTTIVPAVPANQVSQVTWTSGNSSFDGPKVSPINSTTWTDWYFEAVESPTPGPEQASIVVAFYTATPGGFDLLSGFASAGYTSLTLAEAEVTWRNGTTETFLFNATEARITVVGDGASGLFGEDQDTWASFAGSPDMSLYRVDLRSAEISGSLTLRSTAPAHYPCGPAVAGQNLQIAPNIGWANAVPDAEATVHFTIHDQPFEFTGIGYHDQNWGSASIAANVGSWYWGNGRVGDYSIVWYDLLTPDGENTIAAYVARNGEILVAQCAGLRVRPYGANATYPPLISTGNPTGFTVTIDLPDERVELTATGTYITAGGWENAPYTRWSGTLQGRIGGEDLDGKAIFEEFKFLTE
ncbi:hypothetical protein ASPCAL06032 [Aspergillus calidoustus]|uniref:AttH domain-containing protein n=1 Tax=Aspergillus calidoustus TaxID=454130 RepID=A0A0U5C867_ASPCI|nr:hypothetical protein ASPCAL06032 [Aspergillus calidoustus]